MTLSPSVSECGGGLRDLEPHQSRDQVALDLGGARRHGGGARIAEHALHVEFRVVTVAAHHLHGVADGLLPDDRGPGLRDRVAHGVLGVGGAV